MSRKNALLFVVVCLLAGIATFLGSVVGHFFGNAGVNVGAIIGGIAGVATATRIALQRGILARKQFAGATIGGILGFLLAAVIAVNHLDTPIVPLASILLIGLGAVLGAASRHPKAR